MRSTLAIAHCWLPGIERRVGALLAAGLLAAAIAPPALAQNCVGCTPLVDVGGAPYLGTYPLGLYPGVTNIPPAAHFALALQAAAAVTPRAAGSGTPDPAGLTGVIAIGMSNANQEFAVFERQEDLNLARNGRVVIVDAAVGGQSAEVIVNPAAPYWTIVDQRVTASGLDAGQVQVVWLKEVDGTMPTLVFPAHADTLEAHLRGIVRHLKDRFPMLQLCYLSSRIYGGYTSSPQRGEPSTYESGFAIRNLIAAQIAGDPTLNADPGAGTVEAPVLLWGPYLWANGIVPRASDGLTWLTGDYESDFVHPSPLGEQKVATRLSAYFNNDATTTPWYHADTGTDLVNITAEADAYVNDTQPATNFGALPTLQWAYNTVRSYVRFNLSAVADSVVYAKLSFKTPADFTIRAGQVVVVTSNAWSELTVSSAKAPAFIGATLGVIPGASRGTAVSLDVTSAVRAALAAAPGAAKLSLGIRALPGPSAPEPVGSRESVDPPRLVLTTVPAPTSVGRVPPARETLRVTAAPNPFSGTTRITVATPGAARIVVGVYDVRGARIRRVFAGALTAGSREFSWDGKDDGGRSVAGGVYFVRAGDGRAGGSEAVSKIVVVK